MQTYGDRDVRKRRAATEGLDQVNQELLSASWEVDFLAKAAREEAPPAGETRPPIEA
jgi:hypothetical protein